MKHLIMGTAGHVDHGKTSLIKALTNIDCDTHKEEKERGITINLGFSHLRLPSENVLGIIDVPGHKDFINTMVGGASGIDFVLLVIAADSGIMPQTEEHLDIIKTLNIKHVIVALTKIDLVDEELIELAKLEIMEWLDNTEYKNAPIVGVSSTTKEGLDNLITKIDYLIPRIEEKAAGNFFRMYIDRIFTVKGIGSVVTGSVLNGEISSGKELYLLPQNNQKLRIRTIQRHGEEVDNVFTGDRAALNLTGLKSEDFKRGMILSDKKLESTKMVDAQISLFENSPELKLWSSVIFYSGTFESQARIHLLNKDVLKGNDSAIVQIHLEKEGVLMYKDKFIIRNTSGNQSLGGGLVVDSQPLHHRKRTNKLINELELLSSSIFNEGNIGELIKIELQKEKKAISVKDLSLILNSTEKDILTSAKHVKEILRYQKEEYHILILDTSEAFCRQEIINYIQQYHTKNPILNNGLTEVALFGKLALTKNKIGRLHLNILLKKMELEQQIIKYKGAWLLNSFKIEIDKKTEEEINKLEQRILNFDTQKPAFGELKDWAMEQKISSDKLKLYINYLTEKNRLTYIDSHFVHVENIKKFRVAILTKLKTSENGFFFGELREATGLTKKLIPILLGLFENEGLLIISTPEENRVKVNITEKGRNL